VYKTLKRSYYLVGVDEDGRILLKWIYKNRDGGCGLVSCGSGYGRVVGCWVH
jgi:hypothetical protein